MNMNGYPKSVAQIFFSLFVLIALLFVNEAERKKPLALVS